MVGLLGGAVLMGVLQANSTARLPKGQPAPAFQAMRLSGEKVSLADLRGKAFVLTFWGTWCGPCKAELPDLVKLADDYQSKGATLLAVNDYNEDPENMPQYIEHQLPGLKPYAAAASARMFDDYNVDGTFPTLFVIDPNGSVVASHQGMVPFEQVKAWVDEALRRR